MEYNPESIFTNVNESEILTHHSELFEKKIVNMPPYFNVDYKNLCGFHHLNTLYSESYWSICYGFYNSGISLMSLLIELTLREIIRVHTNIKSKGTFEELLRIAHGKHRKIENQKPILHPYVLNILEIIQNEVRNPYHHCNFDTLFKDDEIWIFPMENELNAENLKKGIDDIRAGKIKHHPFPIKKDPFIASIKKTEIDSKKVFDLAWSIYPFFLFLVDEYLNKEITGEYLNKFGSPYDEYLKN